MDFCDGRVLGVFQNQVSIDLVIYIRSFVVIGYYNLEVVK